MLMESLQMLKFALKKTCLDFTGGWITPEHAMEEHVIDQDLLAALFVDESEDVMDRIIQDFAADNSDSETTTIRTPRLPLEHCYQLFVMLYLS
jgi:hypothetical protein